MHDYRVIIILIFCLSDIVTFYDIHILLVLTMCQNEPLVNIPRKLCFESYYKDKRHSSNSMNVIRSFFPGTLLSGLCVHQQITNSSILFCFRSVLVFVTVVSMIYRLIALVHDYRVVSILIAYPIYRIASGIAHFSNNLSTPISHYFVHRIIRYLYPFGRNHTSAVIKVFYI